MIAAVAQFAPTEEISENLAKISSICKKAAGKKSQLVVFPDNSLNGELEELKDVISDLANIARDNKINILTGGIFVRENEKKKKKSFLFSNSGDLIGSQEEISANKSANLNNFYLDDVSVCILTDLDAFNEKLLRKLSASTVNIVVLQVKPISKLEAEAIKELAISLSGSFADLVLVPWRFEPDNTVYSEGGFIAYEGEIIEELNENEEFIVKDVNLKSFIDYKGLREKINLPQILKDKFEEETK